MRLMKESKGAKILLKIDLEENKFKRFLYFRKKFKQLRLFIMKNDRKLSPKEEEIMACFWQHGPMFVREVRDRLDDPKPHFNTVSTFVRGLEMKGWLAHEAVGNSHRYYPLVDSTEYRDKSLGGIVDRFFGRSYLRFVSTLVEEEKITPDDLRDLLNMIQAKDKTRSKD